MAYLRLRDYYTYIQDSQLQQLIRSDDTLRVVSEQAAQAEITSYLVQKYDLSMEFTDLLNFNLSATYPAHQLVQLDGDAYNNTSTYAANDIVVSSGIVYYSKVGSNTGHIPANSPTQWGVLGNQYTLFYIPYPYDLFEMNKEYKIGDIVFRKGKVYKCLQPSSVLTHASKLQFGTYTNLPYLNQLPENSSTQWSTGVAYSFSGLSVIAKPTDYTAWSGVTTYTTGNRVSYNSIIYQALANSLNITPDSDITKWQPVSWSQGDDRSAQLVQKMIDVCIYHLHSAIAPRNIPELRVKRYDDAISWLDKCARGEITLDSPLIQPIQGNRIRYGGNLKNNNSY